ncbi:hypothetical protein F4X73_19105 [Candidatus Poribacteria bacterium]|nr:hypothetical protein [Candidatus Poribacteria bacterium]
MELHVADFIHTVVLLMSFFGAIWKIRKDISNEIDVKIDDLDKRFDAIDKRFDAIDKRLDQINQNHIEHLMQLHALPSTQQSQK